MAVNQACNNVSAMHGVDDPSVEKCMAQMMGTKGCLENTRNVKKLHLSVLMSRELAASVMG